MRMEMGEKRMEIRIEREYAEWGERKGPCGFCWCFWGDCRHFMNDDYDPQDDVFFLCSADYGKWRVLCAWCDDDDDASGRIVVDDEIEVRLWCCSRCKGCWYGDEREAPRVVAPAPPVTEESIESRNNLIKIKVEKTKRREGDEFRVSLDVYPEVIEIKRWESDFRIRRRRKWKTFLPSPEATTFPLSHHHNKEQRD